MTSYAITTRCLMLIFIIQMRLDPDRETSHQSSIDKTEPEHTGTKADLGNCC